MGIALLRLHWRWLGLSFRDAALRSLMLSSLALLLDLLRDVTEGSPVDIGEEVCACILSQNFSQIGIVAAARLIFGFAGLAIYVSRQAVLA